MKDQYPYDFCVKAVNYFSGKKNNKLSNHFRKLAQVEQLNNTPLCHISGRFSYELNDGRIVGIGLTLCHRDGDGII